MKNYKLAILGMAAMAAASCASNTRIEGTLEGAPDDEVVVKLLDVNSYIVLDTVKTDADKLVGSIMEYLSEVTCKFN